MELVSIKINKIKRPIKSLSAASNCVPNSSNFMSSPQLKWPVKQCGKQFSLFHLKVSLRNAARYSGESMTINISPIYWFSSPSSSFAEYISFRLCIVLVSSIVVFNSLMLTFSGAQQDISSGGGEGVESVSPPRLGQFSKLHCDKMMLCQVHLYKCERVEVQLQMHKRLGDASPSAPSPKYASLITNQNDTITPQVLKK